MISLRARRLALLLALLVGILTPLTVAAAPDRGPTTYTVRNGDTISSIASRLDVPGGWDALFAANRDVIGDDPDRLRVGTELTVPTAPPTPAVPTEDGNYVVRSGDTLSTIASDLGVRGGRAALYRANQQRIGEDADRLEVGTRLVVPGATAPLSSSPGSTPAQSSGPAQGSTPPQGTTPPAAAAPDQPQDGTSTLAARAATINGEVPAVAAAAPAENGGSSLLRTVALGAVVLLLVLLVLLRQRRRRRPSRLPVYPATGLAGPAARGGPVARGGGDDTGEVRLVENTTPLTRSRS